MPEMARQMLRTGRKYEEMEKGLRQLFMLEALLENGGDQIRTATALGVSYQTVRRIVRSLGLKATQLRELARQIGEGK